MFKAYNKVWGLFFLACLPNLIFAQTKVGNVQFNNTDTFDTTELMLNGAGQKERSYAIGLYLDFEVDGVEDGPMVAKKDKSMALTIKTLQDFSKDELKELIRNGLERATDGNSYLMESDIRDFLNLLPDNVERYQIFKIFYTEKGGITLYRNKEKLGTLPNSLKFKEALFKIWLGENPVDSELKENLLATFDVNPILGKWKTFDKETGVAVNIMQLYMIDNKIYGAIDRMLRQSERDAVCYKCKGEDKNQKVEGLVVLKKLEHKDELKYKDGLFTDINTGEVSSCQLWIEEDEPNVINFKYKGGGGTHQWRRVEDDGRSNYEDYQTVKKF